MRLEALVPTLDDAVAESRANFVWVCIPRSLCSWKLLFLQDETALTPNLHRCRGKAGSVPVHPKDNALYPFETCTWICVTDSCLFPGSCKSQDKEKSFELTRSQMEASVQLSKGSAFGAHPSKARRQQMFWQLQLPCTRGAEAGGESQAPSRWSTRGRGEWEAAQGSLIAPDSNGLMICGSREPNQLLRGCTREISTSPQLTWFREKPSCRGKIDGRKYLCRTHDNGAW